MKDEAIPALEDIKRADAVFSALAHPARRQIFLSVHFRGQCSAGDIANRFECSWPTTSRHLSLLVDGGLLQVEKQGRNRIYTANDSVVHQVLGQWVAILD